METLVKQLRVKGYRIASIESLTAGMFAAAIARVPGASNVLYGSLVTYQSECKIKVLKVEAQLIEKYGVISKEIADAMALRGAEMFDCEAIVSFSGNAGPDAMDGKPVGLVHMAIVLCGQLHSYAHIFSGDRNAIREQACDYMCAQLLTLLK